MKEILKLLIILSLAGFISSCNSGSSSSNTVIIDGPYVEPPNSDGVCTFNDSVTSCTITLSYQADPAASLSISGVSAPYTVASNDCTNAVESAPLCTVNITYTPQSTASNQTVSFTVGGYTAPITISLTNQQ